jgi:hypothetical protein
MQSASASATAVEISMLSTSGATRSDASFSPPQDSPHGSASTTSTLTRRAGFVGRTSQATTATLSGGRTGAAQTASALDGFDTAMRDGLISHDGSPELARRVGKARRQDLAQRDDQGKAIADP